MTRISSSARPSRRSVPARFISSRVFEPSRATARSSNSRAAVHVAAAKLVQGGLVEDGRMLRIDGLDAHEQRVRTRAITACECALCLRNQLADLACRLRTLIESPVPELPVSLASVRGMIDNAAGLTVLLCADNRACSRDDASVPRDPVVVVDRRRARGLRRRNVAERVERILRIRRPEAQLHAVRAGVRRRFACASARAAARLVRQRRSDGQLVDVARGAGGNRSRRSGRSRARSVAPACRRTAIHPGG